MDQEASAILDVVRRCQDGWNAGDGEAFGAPLAGDADYGVTDGRHIGGRAAIAAGHQHIVDTMYEGSRNTLVVERGRFLRPDIVVAHVLTKAHGDWRVVAFQNSPIAGEAPER